MDTWHKLEVLKQACADKAELDQVVGKPWHHRHCRHCHGHLYPAAPGHLADPKPVTVRNVVLSGLT